jgi:diacylglycerol kinase (ATP)
LSDPPTGAFFFETAGSQESLRRMAVEVPVPDKNGYMVGDEFLPDKSFTPLLVFVNSRSGPQQGHLLTTQLRGLLNPIQIWDLADGGPEEILESFSVFTRLRILVCGGDGTVSWIVGTIDNMKLQRWPPIAILPLGTGNDLARIHGWGGGYNNESLIKILLQVSEGYVSWLDRWEMTIENRKGKIKNVKSFLNYLSVGADAQAALQVHMLRESRPQLFFSRIVNKAWYGLFGAEDIIKATSISLPNDITLIADGVEVPLPADSQGIIMLNIDSYTGGVPLWSMGHNAFDSESNGVDNDSETSDYVPIKRSKSMDDAADAIRLGTSNSSGDQNQHHPTTLNRADSVEDIASLPLTDDEKYTRVTACDLPSSCQDGLLDIVSVRGTFHLGQIRVGLSTAQKLCQCREATIIIKRKVSVQIDGEPWRQNVCTLRVRRKKKAAIMLHRSADESNGVEMEMANLLDWATPHLIDGKVHEVLMKEFSRRIESKTRQRRVQSKDNLMTHLKRAINNAGNNSDQNLGGGGATGIGF